MSIDERAGQLWHCIPKVPRTAFFTCLILGYLTHLYAFTNLIPNSDGLSRMFDAQQMTISGRWFLHYASAPNGYTQMPAVIGLLSLLFLAAAAVLVVDLLQIRSHVLSAAVGGLMVVFPAVGYTFLYLFTASAYCLAIFLAVLSVWLTVRKGKIGFLLGVVALALSMGTYQAYVTLAIGLSMLVVLRRVLDPSVEFRAARKQGLTLAAFLAAGAILYYVILLIVLKVKNLELLSYLGMNSANSGYPFAQLPRLILQAYKQVAAFFFVPGSANGFATAGMAALDVAALILGLIFLIRCIRLSHLWTQLWRPVTALILLLLLPLGLNFSQILSPFSAPTPLMKYSFVLVYVLVLLLADCSSGAEETVGRWLACSVSVWTVLVLLFCLNTNNLLYTVSNQSHRATESYLTRLMGHVEACPGYESGMELAIIGAVPASQLHSQVEAYRKVDHYSVPIHNLLPLNKHIYYYLSDWMNVPVSMPSEEVMISVANTKAFRDMPLYPAQGSVQVLDGRVVVKLQPVYTPKSDYELAYENRR